MRTLPCWVFAGLLVACGTETAPPSSPEPTPTPRAVAPGDTPAPASGHVALTDATSRPSRRSGEAPGTSLPTDAEATATAAAADALRMLSDAAKASPTEQAKLPAAVRALGIAALPGVAQALATGDVPCRRTAALTVLQWAGELQRDGTGAAVMPALSAARLDADLSVRAAAEHAWRMATGDTSALDQTRAADEAANRPKH